MNYKEIAVEASKASPPVGATGMALYGYPLSDWLVLLTIVYTCIQIYFTLKKNLRRRKYGERQD